MIYRDNEKLVDKLRKKREIGIKAIEDNTARWFESTYKPKLIATLEGHAYQGNEGFSYRNFVLSNDIEVPANIDVHLLTNLERAYLSQEGLKLKGFSSNSYKIVSWSTKTA